MEATGQLGVDAQPQQWLQEHGDVLYRYAFARVRSESVAEDLVQDALLAAWEGRDGFDGRCTRRTWLIAILRRKVADHQRQSHRQPWQRGEPFDEAGTWRTAIRRWRVRPDDRLQMQELRDVLAYCLTALPPRLLDVVRRRSTQGDEPQAICNDLGISPTNLRVRLHRARMMLRSCLDERYFGDSSP